MKKMKKIVAFMLVAFLALSVFGNQGVNAGVWTEAEYICDYTPEFKVEAIMDSTAIKVTIPKQGYPVSPTDKHFPIGYEVTLDIDSDTGLNGLEFAKSLYGTCYPNMPIGGYGPYKISDDSKTGKPIMINENGSEERTFIFFDLDPGKYKVKLRAYDAGFEEYYDEYFDEYYYYEEKNYWSLTAEKSISLNSGKAVEIKNGYKTKYDFSKVKKGDTIKFGSYEQDGNIMNGREPIEWVVLEKTKKQMLVISKNNLDRLPFNEGWNTVTWAECALRKWLNDPFFNTAFNKSEQKLISLTTLKNEVNPSTGVSSGKDTKDKVFILSLKDVTNSSYGFSKKLLTHDEKRRSTLGFDANSGGRWWLRTPSFDQSNYLFVGSEGGLEYENGKVAYFALGVRPALYIKLK